MTKETFSVVDKKTGAIIVGGLTLKAASKAAVKEAGKSINTFQIKNVKGVVVASAKVKVEFDG